MENIGIEVRVGGRWIISKGFPHYKQRDITTPMYFSIKDVEDIDRYTNAGFFEAEEATYIKLQIFPNG